jgi:hypothetical protein
MDTKERRHEGVEWIKVGEYGAQCEKVAVTSNIYSLTAWLLVFMEFSAPWI